MKLFKKVMSLIIASIMMLQVAAFAAPAPADVNGTFYEDAAKLLSALEIMVGDGRSFNGDNNITRAEFTKIMVAAAGHSGIVAGYKPKGVFTDVPTKEWYAPYVEFGKDMGAINGMGDGIFAPKDNVTGEQAVKMMVCIAGYGLPAAQIGYPEGYVSVARDLGVLKGITSVDLTKPMTRGQAAVLCANIMKVDVMKKIATGDKEEWRAQKGVTLLSEKFSAYEAEGVVTANASTAIWETSTLKEGSVEIKVGGVKKIFLVGDTDIDTKLGATVKFVYQYDDYEEESTVLCYTAAERDNTSVTVDFEQFDLDGTGAITTNTKGELQYWMSDDAKKAESIAVEAIPAIIYNGVATTSSLAPKAFLESKMDLVGEVTFLDANDTEGAETLIVTAYDNYVIDYIDAENHLILDELDNNKTIKIDIESRDVTATFVDKNGKELSFKDLQTGDVLSIADSGARVGKRIFHVIVCDDVVSGVVKSFGNNERGKFSVALDDGKQYEFGHAMRVAYRTGDLKLGREETFKLDAFGKIAAIDGSAKASAIGDFGLMLRYVRSQSTTGAFEAKVYTAEGEIEILPLAGKVTIDGVKCDDTTIEAALIAASNAAAANNAAFTPSNPGACIFPMLYELDNTGAIKYIDSPYFTTGQEDANTLGVIKNGSAGLVSRKYSDYYKGFDDTVPFNTKAVILAVPEQGGDFENEKNIYYMQQKDFGEGTYNLQMFNTDRESFTYTFGICVTSAGNANAFKTGNDSSEQRKRPLFVVSKTTLALAQNEYGEESETLKVYGMEEGASRTITIDPNYYANGKFDQDGSSNTLLNHLYFGVTFDEYGTADRTVNFTEHLTRTPSAARLASIILPGDIFTYGTNSQGYVQYVRTTFLYEEKAFLSHNYITSGNVKGAHDLAIPVVIDGKTVRFDKISNAVSGFNAFMMESLYDAASGTITKNYEGKEIVSAKTVAGVETKFYDSTKLFADDVRSISGAKIMVVDMKAKNSNQLVTSGSITDIVDTRNAVRTATPCIIRNFNNEYAAIVVFKNL